MGIGGYGGRGFFVRREIRAVMAESSILTLGQFLLRWTFSVFLVFLTYNPFHYSFWHWLTEGTGGDAVIKVLVSIGLFITYMFMIWVILASLGIFGTLAGAAIGILSAVEILDRVPGGTNRVVAETIYLVCIASFFAVGLAWPRIVTRLSGQIQKRYLTRSRKKVRV